MDNHRIVVEGLLSHIGFARYVRCMLKSQTGTVLIALLELSQTNVEQSVLSHHVLLGNNLCKILYGCVHITGLELRYTQKISIVTGILTLSCSHVACQQLHSLCVLTLLVPVLAQDTFGFGLDIRIIGRCHKIVRGLICLCDITVSVQRHLCEIETGLVIMTRLQ